jgi:Raf kinase inhibitor-like YbhB/YbcL family protein
MAFTLASTAYTEGNPIPKRHTCDGTDVSPPLQWSGVPAGARALALILDDPDAPGGTWTHWTVWNMPPGTTELPEGADVTRLGARQGKTSNGKAGYHGPCPPSGRHRYICTLYALSQALDLPEGGVAELRRAMEGKVLGEAKLMGTYARN